MSCFNFSAQSVSGRQCVCFGSQEAERGPTPFCTYPWQLVVLRRVWRPRRSTCCRLLLHIHGEIHQVDIFNAGPCPTNHSFLFLWFSTLATWIKLFVISPQRCFGGGRRSGKSFKESLFRHRQSSVHTPELLQQRWITEYIKLQAERTVSIKRP